MPSIFSKIIAGEIPCHMIDETDQALAFLDISPLQKGHCLVVPKREVDYIFNLENAELEHLIVFSKRIAQAIKQAFPCNRIGMTVIGLEVPHAHIHLIPINQEKDMNFAQKKMQLSAEEMSEIASKIRRFL